MTITAGILAMVRWPWAKTSITFSKRSTAVVDAAAILFGIAEHVDGHVIADWFTAAGHSDDVGVDRARLDRGAVVWYTGDPANKCSLRIVVLGIPEKFTV